MIIEYHFLLLERIVEGVGGVVGWRGGVILYRAVILLCGALLVCVLSACGGGGEESSDAAVEVIATYSILGDLVENVGGGNVQLTTLVGPNGDAHTFEPAPLDNADLAAADVVFQNGLGFEPWLGELYRSSGSEAERVVVTEGIEPLPIAEEEPAGEPAGEDEHEHEEFDPHAWHDPTKVIVTVESIRDALARADPGGAQYYRRNAAEYIAEIEKLDADVRRQVRSIPEDNRTLFTSHDTFGYFAQRYGFGVDTALASVSTETGDPSAGETADLVEEIEASGVPAIFAENVSNPVLMENIASEANVELAPALYTDALGEPGSGGDTYVGMVRYNVSTMSEALEE